MRSFTANHFSLLLQVRWRLFLNGLRKPGRQLELGLQFIGVIMMTLLAIGIGIGFFAGTVAALDAHKDFVLDAMLWAVFFCWQLVPLLIEGYSPGLSFREIARFPVSFQLYYLLNLLYGLLDPAAVAALLWLACIWGGILVERPEWALAAALLLLGFAALNLLANRFFMGIFDRFQGTRKTRERTAVVLLMLMFSLQLLQFIPYYLNKLPFHIAPRQLVNAVWSLNRFSPPGLISQILKSNEPLSLLASTALLLAYALALFLLSRRQAKALYLGEVYAESYVVRQKLEVRPGWRFPGIDDTMAAIVEKELRYIRQNMRLVVQIAYPLLIFAVMLLGRGPNRYMFGFARNSAAGFLCAFAGFEVLGISNLCYNTFGMDREGFARWLLAPLPLRKVILGKNLTQGGIFAAMYFLVSGIALASSGISLLAYVAITISFFAFLIVQIAAGNLMSAFWPKRIELTQMNSRLASGSAGLASFLVILPVGLTVTLMVLGTLYSGLAWFPLAASIVVLAVALKLYSVFLDRAVAYIQNHLEEMESALKG